MVQFFHRELVVAIKVHGPVVLESLNAQIDPVKKCVSFSNAANIRTFLKKRCYLDVEKCVAHDFTLLTIIQNFLSYLTFQIRNGSYFHISLLNNHAPIAILII